MYDHANSLPPSRTPLQGNLVDLGGGVCGGFYHQYFPSRWGNCNFQKFKSPGPYLW